jgi:hypothetical protein
VCNNPINGNDQSALNTSCTILSISPLSMTNTSARLFITGDSVINFTVSDDSNAKVGDNNFNEGLFINNTPIEIDGSITFNQTIKVPQNECTGSAGDPCSGPDGDGTSQQTLTSLSDIKNFEGTPAYSEFIQSIDSISVN